MSRIKIDFDSLTQQASAINDSVQSYDSLISRMKSLSSEIGSSWEGDASQAFQEMLGKYTTEAGKMSDVLTAIQAYAKSVASDFEELDQSCAARIRSSF